MTPHEPFVEIDCTEVCVCDIKALPAIPKKRELRSYSPESQHETPPVNNFSLLYTLHQCAVYFHHRCFTGRVDIYFEIFATGKNPHSGKRHKRKANTE